MENFPEEKVNLLEELNKSKEQAIIAIKDFANELHTILHHLEQESIKEVEKAFREIEILFEEEMTEVQNEMLHMNNSAQTLHTADENKGQRFGLGNITINKGSRLEDLINSMEAATDAKLVFNEDIYIKDALHQIKSLGSVITTKSRTYAYYVSSTKDVNVRLSNDTGTCNVTDACLVGPSTLLLVDNCNKKLKRLHTSQMSVLDQCDVPAHPYCVCLVDKQKAVVSLSNNSIQFVSLGNTMTCARQLNLNHCCYGIACKGDKMYITDSSCSLYIYDKSGKMLQTVSQDSSGNNLFAYSRQITVSDSGKEIFVTDWTNKLTVLDMDGNYINQFFDKTIEQANGVSTDRRGSVFVCGYASRNVIQIGQNGKKKGIITKSSENLIDHPYSVCFVPGQCIMFVTQGNNDRLKVFQLK